MSKKSAYAMERDAAFKLAKKRIVDPPEKDDDLSLWLNHAMKVDLGFVGYRDFYFDILLSSIKDLELTLGEKKELNEMLDKDRFCIETIEERVLGEHCRHAISDKGALYRVSMKIPSKGVAPNSKFFVKRCVDNNTWERTVLLEKYLEHNPISQRFVPKIKYSDKKRRLLGYEFVDGEPLSEMFKTATPEEKENMLRQSIESMVLISHSIACPGGNSSSHGRYDGESYSLKTEDGETEISIGDKTHALKMLNNSSQSLLRMFIVRGNSQLEDKLTSWDGKVSKKAIESIKKKYSSIQALLDSYSEVSGTLDFEPLCFSHGDLHLANILWTGKGPKIIDWEYAAMASRQFDLLKLLKKSGVSEEAEERLLRYAFEIHETAQLRNKISHTGDQKITKLLPNGEWGDEKLTLPLYKELEEACVTLATSKEAETRFEKFKNSYRTLEFHETLLSAAKYLNFSDKSDTTERKNELEGMANFYYTKALNYVRGTELEGRIKEVVSEVHNNRLLDLGENIGVAPNPLECLSMSNLNYPSIIEKVDGKKPIKSQVVRAAKCGTAAAVILSLAAFGIHTHVNKSASDRFLDSSVGMNLDENKHSEHVEKYAKMYGIDESMLHAALCYIETSGERIDFGAASRYSSDPEQLTMSIAKRMHDLKEKHGENYAVILAEMYAGPVAVGKATRMGITGRYVDFRRFPPQHATKVASTMKGSDYFAKKQTRRMVSKCRQ